MGRVKDRSLEQGEGKMKDYLSDERLKSPWHSHVGICRHPAYL